MFWTALPEENMGSKKTIAPLLNIIHKYYLAGGSFNDAVAHAISTERDAGGIIYGVGLKDR
jgi:hypothetical protein